MLHKNVNGDVPSVTVKSTDPLAAPLQALFVEVAVTTGTEPVHVPVAGWKPNVAPSVSVPDTKKGE